MTMNHVIPAGILTPLILSALFVAGSASAADSKTSTKEANSTLRINNAMEVVSVDSSRHWEKHHFAMTNWLNELK